MPSKKTPTPKKPRGKKPVGLTSAIGPKATTVLVICVMAGGIAAASWQKDQAAKARARDEAMMMAADTMVADPVVPLKKSAKTRAPAATTSAPAPVPTPALTTAPSATAKPDATVTGCLERTDDGFRLKDTEGENAPKSRSWKSGFLKKGAASISVIDPSRTLRLGNQVGRRVTVTGALANRELRAAAIHQVASSCK
jgi:hypothetical protein